jgi:FKBP-type peptidyl-prolyl cis-trans isomerase FklB
MAIKLDTPKARMSYAMGMNLASYLGRLPVDLDRHLVCEGFFAILEGDHADLSPDEYRQAMDELAKAAEKGVAAAQEAAGKENQEAEKRFFAENGKKPGVVTTASGLQYEVLRQTEGPKPASTSKVTVHYEGKLLNGQVFDSSLKRGTPAEFPVNAVISGWTEALQLMSIGSKYRLFIPASLGYGARGAGNDIPPYATLVFEVELLGFK